MFLRFFFQTKKNEVHVCLFFFPLETIFELYCILCWQGKLDWDAHSMIGLTKSRGQSISEAHDLWWNLIIGVHVHEHFLFGTTRQKGVDEGVKDLEMTETKYDYKKTNIKDRSSTCPKSRGFSQVLLLREGNDSVDRRVSRLSVPKISNWSLQHPILAPRPIFRLRVSSFI